MTEPGRTAGAPTPPSTSTVDPGVADTVPADPPEVVPDPRPPAPIAPPSRFRRAISGSYRFLRVEDRGFRVVVSLVLSTLFTGGILWYTRGGLLYGMDYVGIYSWQGFFIRPRTDYLIPSLASAATLGQTYATFYVSIFVETAVICYACQSFVRALFLESFTPSDLRLAQAIAAGLYLASPALVTYRYISVVAAVFLSAAALFFVFRYLIDAAKAFRGGTLFPWSSVILMGISIGLTAPDSLPNDARVVALESVGLLGLVLIYLVVASTGPKRRKTANRNALRVFGGAVPIGAAILFYPFYSFLTSQGFGVGNVGQVAAAYAPQLQSGSYDTLDFSIRLLGRQSFPHVPYYSMYTTNHLVQGATYLWPFLALIVPLAVAAMWEFRDRWLLVPLGLIALAGAFWEAGSHPPLGPVYVAIVGFLPYGSTFFQEYSITNILLSKFYPVLIAFAIVVLGHLARSVLTGPTPDGDGPGRPTRKSLIPSWEAVTSPGLSAGRRPRPSAIRLGVILALVAGCAMAALPIFNGVVEQSWVDTNARGYFIPPEYAAVRSELHAVHGSAILLPQVSTYVRTSWGFQGANGFYINYNYPSEVLVPGFYGPYGAFIPQLVQNYTAATNPVISGPPQNPITANLAARLPVTPLTGGIRYDFHPAVSLNLAQVTWLYLSVGIQNESQIQRIIQDGNFWVGLTGSDGNSTSTAWYVVGGASNAVESSVNSSGLSVSVMPMLPSSVTGGGGGQPAIYSPSNLSNISLVSYSIRENVSSFDLIQGVLSLQTGNLSSLASGWLNQIGYYGMGYILVDSSLVSGNQQTYPLVAAILTQLQLLHAVTLLHSGPYLQLYQIVSSPATMGPSS